jgi:DNA-binding response OmpR family regulator
LTDVIMPGMTGKELADRFVTLWPRTKVLFVSGYSADVLGRHGVLDPDVAYVAKPFTPTELATRVREVLRISGHILIIDDDDAVRAWLEQVLTQAGFGVSTAANGKDGCDLVQGGHFDLVITDLVMPEQEGLETVQLLRREHPEIPIIAISGAFHGDFLKTARILGAQATLAKPVDRDRLLATVADLMRQGTLSPVD